jgi:hypothetical protein
VGAIELDRMAWPEVQASADHDARYWEAVETIALSAVASPG